MLTTKPVIEQDLVLIHIEEKPAFYGRIEKITADVKPKWWQVTFLALSFPVQLLTWILDDEQIRGADFTMGGTPIRIEKVKVPGLPSPPEGESPSQPEDSKSPASPKARVLSLHDNKKTTNS